MVEQESFEKHVPEGIRKHIANELKPRIRNLKTPESDAWQCMEQIIGYQIEGWPERFRLIMDLVHDYNRAEYAATHDLPIEEKMQREKVLNDYDQEEFAIARPVLRVIRQAYH